MTITINDPEKERHVDPKAKSFLKQLGKQKTTLL